VKNCRQTEWVAPLHTLAWQAGQPSSTCPRADPNEKKNEPNKPLFWVGLLKGLRKAQPAEERGR
jgi:hypothetical protein